MSKRLTTMAMVEGVEKVYRSIIGQATIRPEDQKFDSRSIKYTNRKGGFIENDQSRQEELTLCFPIH
jgi:hypothetical protein